MGATPVDWNVGAVAIGPGQCWTNLAIPGAGGKLTLASDGTPDSVQNPNAVHIGMTEAGSAISLKQTFTDFFADEFVDPIIRHITAQEAAITGSWLQLLEMSLIQLMTPGTVRADGFGYERVTFGGSNTVNYYSTALIFPLENNSALFGVFHLYKAINDPGLAFSVGRKKLGAAPFAFRGLAITSRAAGDQVGAYWKQTGIGS